MKDNWTISKTEVADLLRLEVLARLHEVEEKLALFARIHDQTFDAFEQTTLRGKEEFEQWDDYLEWKAYRQMQDELQQKLAALTRGHFKVA
jgi:hypothetical protein